MKTSTDEQREIIKKLKRREGSVTSSNIPPNKILQNRLKSAHTIHDVHVFEGQVIQR